MGKTKSAIKTYTGRCVPCERTEKDNLLNPIVPIRILKEELIKISSPFSFKEIGILLLPIFKHEVIKIAEISYEFNNTTISNNYILFHVLVFDYR